MTVSVVAPLLRGIALAAAGPGGSVVVASAPLPPVLPADAVRIDIADDDEAAAFTALRAAYSRRAAGAPALFAANLAGAGEFLLAAASDIDAARVLVAGGAVPSAGRAPAPAEADSKGSAAGRDRVVSGRIALVTGGAQGFGEEIARGLAASGALVWVADINGDGARRLAAELTAKAGRTAAIAVAMDVTSEESVADAISEIARTTGGLDLVVSNAGVLKAGSVLDQELGAFDSVTRVNYTGFFLVAKHAANLMRRQRLGHPGHRTDIVQINSKSGLAGSNRNGAYAGSKFGGIGLVQSFALELVEYGIKVNAICPGNFLDGPLWSDQEKGLFVQYLRTGKVPGAKTIADVRAFYEAKVPMGRGCEGPDVMRAIYYLVEQEYETGQALPVTGGQVMLT
ncbi:MAG: SDR family NAD(P)-dependent oxidoreductase [Spirochaetes bacterium]|nr:SDR family NAD(P)-dependent oxidoreductase [Spirochaetota bacterium]